MCVTDSVVVYVCSETRYVQSQNKKRLAEAHHLTLPYILFRVSITLAESKWNGMSFKEVDKSTA